MRKIDKQNTQSRDDMNILFICKFNRFRSKIAEEFFRGLNTNKTYHVKSAGLIRGSPISKHIQLAAKEFGLHIHSKPTGLSTQLLQWQDLAIIIGDDVPPMILSDSAKYGKKVLIWHIADTTSTNRMKIKRIIVRIEFKVKQLIRRLQ